MALVVASHFGGSLTHGRGYLVRHAPPWLRGNPPTVGGTAGDADGICGVAKPVLDQYCVACHGPEKAKRAAVDTLAALRAGGDSVRPSARKLSKRVVARMRLPLSDDDHMPPEGKPSRRKRRSCSSSAGWEMSPSSSTGVNGLETFHREAFHFPSASRSLRSWRLSYWALPCPPPRHLHASVLPVRDKGNRASL
jgi:hypothetical protein